jgi:hypothetical protein
MAQTDLNTFLKNLRTRLFSVCSGLSERCGMRPGSDQKRSPTFANFSAGSSGTMFAASEPAATIQITNVLQNFKSWIFFCQCTLTITGNQVGESDSFDVNLFSFSSGGECMRKVCMRRLRRFRSNEVPTRRRSQQSYPFTRNIFAMIAFENEHTRT